MRLPARPLPLLLLATTLVAAATCAPAGDIEPVPSPMQYRFSALASQSGWVSAVGDSGGVAPGVTVRLRNVDSGAVAQATAAADGTYAFALPADRGDTLELAPEGYQAVTHVAAAPAADAPPAPGTDDAPVGVSGPDDEGRYVVSCAAGCLPDGGGLVVYVVSPAGGMLTRVDVDAAGAFAALVRGAPGDALFAFAAREDASGPTTTLYLPLGIDDDEDGFDATVDCDDGNGATRPGVREVCNGIDDNCNGHVDESCHGAPCTSDEDCQNGRTCDPDVGECLLTAVSVRDRDGDGVPDEDDVCPNIEDPDQADLDEDGRGDACDADVDGDRSPAQVDCDDRDPRRGHNFPETCGDGVDNDCDGDSDEGC